MTFRKNEILKCGVIGCGEIFKLSYLPILKKDKEIKVTAICDKDKKLLPKTARAYDVENFYDDASNMFKNESLDFVIICSPPKTHHPLSIQAMKMGIPVLMEKPMALNSEEAEEMLFLSKKQGVKLCVVHNFLYFPVIQKALLLENTGFLGKILSTEIRIQSRTEYALANKNHWSHNLPGGIFGEFLPHAVYLTQEFVGDIENVKGIAIKNSDFPWVNADEIKLILEGKKGPGYAMASFNSPKISFTMDIFGTERIIHIDFFRMTILQFKKRKNRIRDLLIEDAKTIYQIITEDSKCLARRIVGKRWFSIGHQEIMKKFIHSLKTNCEVPVNGGKGKETVEVLQKIWSELGKY